MKLKLLLVLLIINSSNIGYCQKLTVNKKIDVQETKISDNNTYSREGMLYCYDIMNKDTITVYVSRAALDGYTFKLQMIDGEIIPKIVKWTDYPAYDGKSSFEFDISGYELEINDTVFKPSDTLRVKFNIVTKIHKYSKKKKFKGEIFHIVGGNQYVWEKGKSLHHKFWKNGKQVYTIQDDKED